MFHEYQQWFDPTGAFAAMASDVPQGTGRNAVVPPPVECMLPATPDSLARAKVCAPSHVLLLRRRAHLDGGVCASPQAFAREITAGGLTDILHPVQQAFGLLSEVARQRPSSFAVPVCFLMTVCTHSCKPPHAMGCSDEHDCCGCVDGVCVCVWLGVCVVGCGRGCVQRQDGAVPNEREVCKVRGSPMHACMSL